MRRKDKAGATVAPTHDARRTTNETVRLSKFLARAGVTSRRGAAELVASGRVRINGKPPRGPGDPVDPAADQVTLDGKPLRQPQATWLAFHKPPGFETSRKSSGRHPTVFSLLKQAPDSLVAVGRLDVMSEGLLLLTTDGELAARLMHPRWEVARVYRVTLTDTPGPEARDALDKGVRLPDEPRPVKPRRWRFTAEKQGRGKGGALEIELAEGRSRVVRRLCAELGLGIRSLRRTGYGPLVLGDLPRGQARALSDRERGALYAAVKLPVP